MLLDTYKKENHMPHKIPNPMKRDYKMGDRVQHLRSGAYGTVTRDQNGDYTVSVDWEDDPGMINVTPADWVRVAPWHGIGYVPVLHIDVDTILADFSQPFTDAGSFGGAVKAGFQFKDGDRVKLKYNRMCGTVVGDQVQAGVYVHWDKHPEGHRVVTPVADLVPLHTPRDTDPVNPNQEAIDAIEALRVPLKKEIEALQAKLSSLTQAKKLLERG
jgi:hypothetical protein